ncbi:hypothetical protein [Thiolapillus sp.]|uniref:hypothetical protein n=3 Tax=Thiolapillus sp. TaxID=2017437 RepID=UPI0025D033E3|nr:hypothetical protein [Thiolapillus sp.]
MGSKIHLKIGVLGRPFIRGILSFVVLVGIVGGTTTSYARLSLFANIEKERSIMVSRDALRTFVKKHQAEDKEFRWVYDVRDFYGATVAIDVYPKFLELPPKVQYKLAQKILDAWEISLPKHLSTASVSLYVKKEPDWFLSKRILHYAH